MQMSWQYIAGFFDGEGSVGMSRKVSSGVARIFVSIPQLGKKFGLSQSAISTIQLGKSWKHLLPFIGDNQAYGIKPSFYLT